MKLYVSCSTINEILITPDQGIQNEIPYSLNCNLTHVLEQIISPHHQATLYKSINNSCFALKITYVKKDKHYSFIYLAILSYVYKAIPAGWPQSVFIRLELSKKNKHDPSHSEPWTRSPQERSGVAWPGERNVVTFVGTELGISRKVISK